MFLTGGYAHTMDENGRIIIPSKIRDGIGSMFYLCTDLNNPNQLEGLSPEDFEEKAKMIAEQHADDPNKVEHFFEYSELITVDKQGRTVIPEKFRKKAGLGTEIMIIGMLSKFIIKNNVPSEAPDPDELREFNRKISHLIKEKREKEKTVFKEG